METMQSNLKMQPGQIWIMIALDDKWFRDTDDQLLVDALIHYMSTYDLGIVDGESSGGGAMDVNFDVQNLRLAAEQLDQFMKNTYPEVRYYITDHYDPQIEVRWMSESEGNMAEPG